MRTTLLSTALSFGLCASTFGEDEGIGVFPYSTVSEAETGDYLFAIVYLDDGSIVQWDGDEPEAPSSGGSSYSGGGGTGPLVLPGGSMAATALSEYEFETVFIYAPGLAGGAINERMSLVPGAEPPAILVKTGMHGVWSFNQTLSRHEQFRDELWLSNGYAPTNPLTGRVSSRASGAGGGGGVLPLSEGWVEGTGGTPERTAGTVARKHFQKPIYDDGPGGTRTVRYVDYVTIELKQKGGESDDSFIERQLEMGDKMRAKGYDSMPGL